MKELNEVRSVKIVNDAGDLIMSLGSDHYGKEPELRMYSSKGEELLVLFARSNGEVGVSILAPTGQVKTSICSTNERHGVVVYNTDGESVYELVWPENDTDEAIEWVKSDEFNPVEKREPGESDGETER